MRAQKGELELALRRLRIGRPVGVAILAVFLCTAPAGAAEGAPERVIESFHATLLDVMKNAKSLGFEGRRAALAPGIEETFHLPEMARLVVGPHWRRLTPEQRATLVDAFGRLTIATYANRFDGYGGERFRTLGTDPVRSGAVMVRTEIAPKSEEPVRIDYRMEQFPSGWRVIDIYLEATYSELATRRSEYSSLIRRKGFDALIREIDGKIAQYAGTEK